MAAQAQASGAITDEHVPMLLFLMNDKCYRRAYLLAITTVDDTDAWVEYIFVVFDLQINALEKLDDNQLSDESEADQLKTRRQHLATLKMKRLEFEMEVSAGAFYTEEQAVESAKESTRKAIKADEAKSFAA